MNYIIDNLTETAFDGLLLWRVWWINEASIQLYEFEFWVNQNPSQMGVLMRDNTLTHNESSSMNITQLISQSNHQQNVPGKLGNRLNGRLFISIGFWINPMILDSSRRRGRFTIPIQIIDMKSFKIKIGLMFELWTKTLQHLPYSIRFDWNYTWDGKV